MLRLRAKKENGCNNQLTVREVKAYKLSENHIFYLHDKQIVTDFLKFLAKTRVNNR
jgi:hypothetical protein